MEHRSSVLGAISQHGGWMIRSQFGEEHVEGDGFGTLSVQFVDDSSINVTRPVETRAVTEAAAEHAADGFVVDEHKAEIGGAGRLLVQGLAGAPVERHPFEALGETEFFVAAGERLQEDHQAGHAATQHHGNELAGSQLTRRRAR